MRAYCEARGLPVLEAGKVIVARDEAEVPVLDELHRRATANGARVRFVDEQELAELEPLARTVGKALHSLDTAVVDPRAVLAALRAEPRGDRGRAVPHRDELPRPRGPRDGPDERRPDPVRPAGERGGGLLRRGRPGLRRGPALPAHPVQGHLPEAPPRGVLSGERQHLPGARHPEPLPRRALHAERGRRRLPRAHRHPRARARELRPLARGRRGDLPILAEDARLFLSSEKFRSVALSEPRKYVPYFFHRDAARLVRRYNPALFGPADKVGIRPSSWTGARRSS